MVRPQRVYAAKASRGAVQLAVACCFTGGVYCKEVSGTKYPGYQQKVYLKPNGEPHTKMGAEEYADFVEEAWQHFMRNADFRSRHRDAWVLHDRDPAHRGEAVRQRLEKLRLDARLLPPRSPDLQPLDYGIFGNCKRQLAKESMQLRDWQSKAIEFKKLVEAAPFQNVIRQFPLRLQACVKNGGRHFESDLSAMRKSMLQDEGDEP